MIFPSSFLAKINIVQLLCGFAWAVLMPTLSLIAPTIIAAEINVYTDRQEIFLRNVFAEYERESGDSVNVLFVKKGLLERVKAEGKTSPADIFIVLDIARMLEFVNSGLTTPINAPALQVSPPALRDTDGDWYALTRRARAIYLAPNVEVHSYTDLAKPQYHGMICIRSGTNTYNNALFADMINRMGLDNASKWLSGVKNNLARTPQGKDRTQIKGVAGGQCKIGIANSYYYFGLLRDADDAERAKLEAIKLHIPHDAHINIVGMALAKNAPQPQAARHLMQFLLSKKAQSMLAMQNGEFPVRDDIPFPAALQPYQEIIMQTTPDLAGNVPYRKAASEMVEAVNFDR